MSIHDDADPDWLISYLSGPLTPPARQAFRAAAEDALSRVPCWGEGAIYRAVAGLQRTYFDPPAGTGFNVHHDRRASKLRAEPPLKFGRDRRYTRRSAG